MKTKLVFFGSFNKSMFDNLWTNRSQPHPSLLEDWVEYRFNIWNKYTWESIQNQTRDDWTYVICCHPDTKDLIDKYFGHITDERLIIAWSGSEKPVIEKLAEGCDNVIMCRLDSDDMYHRGAAEYILSDTDEPEWAYFPVGYALDVKWLEVYEWNCHGVGPFFYHRYPAEKLRLNSKIEEPPHRSVMKNNPKKMANGMFMVTLHEKNTSSGMHCRNLTKRFDDDIPILKEFRIKP